MGGRVETLDAADADLFCHAPSKRHHRLARRCDARRNARVDRCDEPVEESYRAPAQADLAREADSAGGKRGDLAGEGGGGAEAEAEAV